MGLAVVAGGSGGHILPALTIANNWKQENSSGEILFFYGTRGIDSKILGNKNLDQKINLGIDALPGKIFLLYPIFFIKFFNAFIKSFFYLIKNRPCEIISTGGFVAIPVVIAGWMLQIPVSIYELNAEPGKTTNFLARFASKIFITFEECKARFSKQAQDKCVFTQYPLRFIPTPFAPFDTIFSTKKSLRANGNLGNTKTILILGGSQGSVFLNTLFKEWVIAQSGKYPSIQVIHQTGVHDKTDWEVFYSGHSIPARVFDFCENLEEFYQCADIVICRAGAGTLFELEFFNKPAIVIPLVTSETSHQTENALAMMQKHPQLFSYVKQEDLKSTLKSLELKLNRYVY